MVMSAGAGRQGAAASKGGANSRNAGAANNARGARAPAVGQSAREIARLADSMRDSREEPRVRERGLDADKERAKERPTAVPVRVTPSRERERERCTRQPSLCCVAFMIWVQSQAPGSFTWQIWTSACSITLKLDVTAADARVVRMQGQGACKAEEARASPEVSTSSPAQGARLRRQIERAACDSPGAGLQ